MALGFEETTNTEQIVRVLHLLCEKAIEWPDSGRMCVLVADIKQAFDNLHPRVIVE